MKRAILILGISTQVWATGVSGVEIIDSRTETFSGAELSAVFKVENYKLKLEGIEHHGTRMAIQFRTGSVPELEKFGVVQFFRGCQFGSSADSKSMNVMRRLFGESVVFQARQWQVDSDDVDPIYNSPEDPGLIRQYFYRWSPEKDLFSSLNQFFFGRQKPGIPALHITDRPGQAWHDPESDVADNISLEFKTCLYQVAQIPRVSIPEKTEFGEAIQCFPWRSSFVFDHSNQKMGMPQAIDPFCGVE
jgi:hypothetical protein